MKAPVAPVLRRRLRPLRGGARTQRGAALFIALMILIIMTLLALSASQVTSLQERMSNVYRADNLAFQSAEEDLRDEEREETLDPLTCDLPPVESVASGWLDGSVGSAVTIENLNNPLSPYARGVDIRGSARAGLPTGPGSPTCMIMRVSSYAFDTDDAATATSRAIVQSTYTP